jgi:hypothetical protein
MKTDRFQHQIYTGDVNHLRQIDHKFTSYDDKFHKKMIPAYDEYAEKQKVE